MAKALMCPPELFDIDLSGKIAVVTGANSGIGLVTTEQLAKQGAEVVLACRRPAEGERVASEIRERNPQAKLRVMALDLGSLASVRAFAAAFTESQPALHFLVNNAGVMNTKEGLTADGFETQIGVNHLSHFLLTELLLPVLKAAAPARIVCLSSCYHDKAMGRDGQIHFDDPFFKESKYDSWTAYAQSKLANLLHAKELAKRLDGTGVTAVSVHPGWVQTNLAKHTMPLWLQNTLLMPFLRLSGMISPWQGAQTSLFALLSPSIPEHAGEFYSQTGMYRTRSANKGGWPLRSPNPNATDENATRLWQLSEKLVGLQ